MWRLAASLIIVCPMASLSFAAPITPRVTATEFPDAVVVYVHDLDLLRAAQPTLTAEVRLAGVDLTYRADLAASYQTPAIFIRKARPQPCGKIAVVIRSGDKEVFREDLATGPVVKATPRIPMTDVKAFIEPGRGMGEAPTILQPDLAKLPLLSLSDAKWSFGINAIAARVESEVNFPLVSANNNCAITRQTAHPEDPTRRSCYVPFKSQIYDAETGNAGRVVHYLVEVPLNPEWLNGTEDSNITLDVEQIRVHTNRRRWPPDNPHGQFITGQGPGGLGQMVGSVAVDAEGNVYYSASIPSHVVRFNVAKAEFEPPPIDIMAAMNEYLPKKEDMPEAMRGKGARWDTYGYVAIGGGRLFFSPVRYASYGSVYCNGVFSFPLEHWYEADQFRAGLRFVAGSWPGSPAALYDEWPTAGAAAFKVAPGVYHDSKYWMTSYANARGGPWCVELNEDGSPKGLRMVTHADINDARQATQPKLRERALGCIHWSDYGTLTTTRAQLSQTLTGRHDATAKGSLTLYYDAIAAMRLAPERYADILDNLKGPSLAPCYMAIGIPDKPGHVLGVGEYGYYLGDFDLTTAPTGVVTKRYLQLDHGQVKHELPVKVGLGPYGHLWWRDGDKQTLIMCGYTGIASMLYSVRGQPLKRHDSILLHPALRSLDGAKAGGMKWNRYPAAGLDRRIYLTGTHSADRGGGPYCTGLQTFSPANPTELLTLSHMSRGSNTYLLRTRLLIESDGRKRQQFLLAGGRSVKAYILMMDGKDLPGNPDAKHFLYECPEGEEPTDVVGFSAPVVKDTSGIVGQVFSRDRRYLVTLQHGSILTFDLANWHYVDGRKLDAEVWEFSRPDYCFVVAPDDRIFLCAQTKDAGQATFYELDISSAGAIAVKPHLTITASNAAALRPIKGAVLTFVADPKDDGSYDLCLGPWWRMPGTQLWVAPDFLPPRVPQPTGGD